MVESFSVHIKEVLQQIQHHQRVDKVQKEYIELTVIDDNILISCVMQRQQIHSNIKRNISINAVLMRFSYVGVYPPIM